MVTSPPHGLATRPSATRIQPANEDQGGGFGTWLESHFRWQIRTFWFGLVWVALCILFVVATFGLGIFIAWLPLFAVGLWFIYRVARGWLALKERRPMYA